MARNFTPEEAVERYLKERKHDLSESTLYNYKSNLGLFTDWCSCQSDIHHISDIDQFDISDFKMYKREDVADTTLYNTMMALRTFIKWCESKGLLKGLSENIILPDRGRAARVEKVDAEKAEALLKYLKKYEYATYRHAAIALMWDAGLRIGAVRSLDVEDYHSEGYVELHHRPGPGKKDGLNKDRGTPLKNGEDSEREVNIHEWVVEIVDDYLEDRRREHSDKRRRPLLTTSEGRPARTTLRRNIRALTRPCHYTNTCPVEGRDMETCDATTYSNAADCPESNKPHSFRRGAITAWLNEGHSKELISDRMDVTTDVLDEHYDQRTEEEKRELRRELFEMGEQT